MEDTTTIINERQQQKTRKKQYNEWQVQIWLGLLSNPPCSENTRQTPTTEADTKQKSHSYPNSDTDTL